MKLAIFSILTFVTGGIASQLTVETLTGKFTGLIDPEFPNTRQFRAIPFAEPPVVSRRWLPPKKLPPSTEHHYATRFPPSCPQFVSAELNFYNSPLTKGNLIFNGNQNDTSALVGEATSEDCLYLAIWAPTLNTTNTIKTNSSEGLPVLFFMTGGGFIIGGIDIPWQMPTSWVERSKSHIIVTINYRVNIFGFPNARGLKDGEQNLGILDERAALEWVRDNIAAFGGDPTRITQWGRSAGALSADIHAYAFHDDPIAQGYYLNSGNAFTYTPRQDPTHSNFTFVARQLGCDDVYEDKEEEAAAELDCMRQKSFIQISNFYGQYYDSGVEPWISFNLVPDDIIVFNNYTQRSEEGKLARVPFIVSSTSNEYSALIVSNLTAGPDQDDVLAYDIRGACKWLDSIVYRNKLDIPVFAFQTAGQFPNLNYYSWLGAYHASDIPLVFGTYHLLDGVAPTTDFEVQNSESIQDHILAFVKDPYHGPQTLGWNPIVASEPDLGDMIRFGAGGKVWQPIHGVDVFGVCVGIGEYDQFP